MEDYSGIPAIFGCDVFNESTMRQRLAPECYAQWKSCVQQGTQLQMDVANEIAEAMKNWAVEKGATHYTHWFQPMTGITAEKHDSFIHPTDGGKAIMEFSGKALVKGEPDASSFPSGGLRSTFEARGYSAWDPTAFAFVKDGSLYIPTLFFSYTGQALDNKTPLLRSVDEVSREAVRILRLLGDHQTRRVQVSVGAEQEYFLIPKSMYSQREDLRLTGRTLFGAVPPKGQELGDHYFGTIRPQVAAYMRDLDLQLWRLGIPAKTKHNESAPCQHELAPVYTDAGNACDGNQLIMEIMKKCAEKHDFVCLLHEKPFAGVNGSGKHNNWSLCTDTGRNLFSPGKTPVHNAQFLVFLAAFIKGVDEYQDLLRCAVASAGNDLRLGGQEAPPAILSIYLGQELTDIVQSITEGKNYQEPGNGFMRIGVDAMPAIPRDTSDRNRTSPIAFTGNKFEFRMLGSSASIAEPNIILNTIMAQELGEFADFLEKARDQDAALQELVCNAFTNHRRVLYNGNGYSTEWKAEAKRRGLRNHPCTPLALNHWLQQNNVDLVTGRGVYSREEYIARYEIHLDTYVKQKRIEAMTMVDMVMHQILPAALRYSSDLAEGLLRKEKAGVSALAERSLGEQISGICDSLYQKTVALASCIQSAPSDLQAAAQYYGDLVVSHMAAVRGDADFLEKHTGREYWPYPIYSDILYY